MSHSANRVLAARTGPVLLAGPALILALCFGPMAPSVAGTDDDAPAPAAGVADHGDDHPHADHGGEHGHHAHTIHGEPPRGLLGKGTEFLAIDPILFFWTLGIFVITAILLRNFAWTPMIEMIERRERRIAESLAKAETIRAQTQALLAEQDAELAKAHDEAKRILEAARAEATAKSEAILAAARDAAAKAQAEAQAQIDHASAEAVARLRASTAVLSATMAGKLAHKSYDPREFERLVEETGA